MNNNNLYNNFYFLQDLISQDKKHAINFINSMGKKNFCRVMFTNAIFAVLDFFDDLDHDKMIDCMLKAVSKGYTYFIRTVCEKSVKFTSLIFPEYVRDGISHMPDSNVTLSSFDKYYNIFVTWKPYEIIGTRNMKNIKKMKINYMGRMTLDDLPGSIEDDPSATDKRPCIEEPYTLAMFKFNDKNLKKELQCIFHEKKSDDINIIKLYIKYINLIKLTSAGLEPGSRQ